MPHGLHDRESVSRLESAGGLRRKRDFITAFIVETHIAVVIGVGDCATILRRRREREI